MSIEYECNINEVAELSLVRYRSVPAVRRLELGFGLATALLLGAATAARTGGTRGLVAGLASAVLAFVVYRLAARWLQRRVIRRSWRNHLGRERIRVQVESTPPGLVIRFDAHETVTPWPAVRPPVPAPRGLLLRDTAGTLVSIPHSAFATDEEANAFERDITEAAGRPA